MSALADAGARPASFCVFPFPLSRPRGAAEMLPSELSPGVEDLPLASAALEFGVRAPPSSDMSGSLSVSPASPATCPGAESLCASTNPTMCSSTDFEAPAHSSPFTAVGEPPQSQNQSQNQNQLHPPPSACPVPEPPGGGAPAPPVELKLFVGRLSPSTDEEALRHVRPRIENGFVVSCVSGTAFLCGGTRSAVRCLLGRPRRAAAERGFSSARPPP